MNNKLRKILYIAIFIITLISSVHLTFAVTPDVTEFVKDIGDQAGLYSPDQNGLHESALDKPGIDIIQSTILQIVDFGKYILGTLCIIMLGVLALKMNISSSSEETITEAKNHFMYALIGFAVVMVADYAVVNVFYGAEGEVLQNVTTAKYFARMGSLEVLRIVHGIEALLGAIAVLVIVINGFRIATNGGGEIDAQKDSIKWACAGLVLIGLSELIVKNIFYADQGKTVDLQTGIELLITMTNYISGFAGFIAVAAVIYGGIQYATAGANEGADETGKNAIKAAVIGLIIMAGGYALTYTLIEFGY